jgi:uncharacterized protein (TIGR03086 family)
MSPPKRLSRRREVGTSTAELQDLAATLDCVKDLIAGVTHDDWDDPTPCTEGDWTVRDLVQHLATGNMTFIAALRGQPEEMPSVNGASDTESASLFANSASTLLDLFAEPDMLDRTITVPFGNMPASVALHVRITELLVHGWDLATATGQVATFPSLLVEQEITFSQPLLDSIAAQHQGRSQHLPEEAPAIDRLAALLGRHIPTEASQPASRSEKSRT